MYSLTIGECNLYPFSASPLSPDQSVPLFTPVKNTDATNKSASDSKKIVGGPQTEWEKYLALKECALNIKLPASAAQQDTLSERIRHCQTKINNINEDSLKKILDNKTNLEFFQHSAEMTQQCIREAKEVIEDITFIVDAIKTETDGTSNDNRSRAKKVIFFLAGFALTGVAISLSVFILPSALSALFITSAVTVSILSAVSKFAGPILTALGTILNFIHSIKNINTEIDNDSWRQISETFSELRVCLQEVGTMNVEILVDGLRQFHTTADKFHTTAGEIEKKADEIEKKQDMLSERMQEILLSMTNRLERLELENKRLNDVIQSTSQERLPHPSPTHHAAGSSRQREMPSPPVPQLQGLPQRAETSLTQLIPPRQSYHNRER